MNPNTLVLTASSATCHRTVGLEARCRVAAIIACATALKLAVSPLIGLGTNEAYAVFSGRLLSLSYFDHPPLHFWLAHLCEMVLGYTAAARIPFILLSAMTSWMMFALTRRLFGDRAGVWATLALNLSIFFNFVSGSWILPDGPLNLFLLATAFVLTPSAQGRDLKIQQWCLAGLFAGLAALSKYHAFLFLAGYLGFLLVDRDCRRVLLTPGPWIAVVIALAIFSPVLVWNGANGWASLHFQGGRAIPHRLGLGLFLSLLSAQCTVLLPGALIPLVLGIRKSMRNGRTDERFLLWCGLPIVLLFTFIPLVSGNGMMHWSMPGWLLLTPLAGKFLDEASRQATRPQKYMGAAVAMLFVGTIAGAIEFQSGWLGTTFPHLFKRGDPTADNMNWSALAPVLLSENGTQRHFVLTQGWREAAKIDESVSGRDRVIVASNDPRNFAIGLNPKALEGQNGWIVLRTPVSVISERHIRGCFRNTAHAANVVVGRGDIPDARLTVFRGDHFIAARCGLLALQN